MNLNLNTTSTTVDHNGSVKRKYFAQKTSSVALLSSLTLATSLAVSTFVHAQQQTNSDINSHAQAQLQAAGGGQLILDLGPVARPAPVLPATPSSPIAPKYIIGPNGQLLLAPPQHQMQPYQPVRAQVMGAGVPTSGQWTNPNQTPRLAAHPQPMYDPRPTVGMANGIAYQPHQIQQPQTIFAAPQPPRIQEPAAQPEADSNVVYSSPLFASTVVGADNGPDVQTKISVPASYGQASVTQPNSIRLGTPSYQPVTLSQASVNGQQARVVQLSGPTATSTSTVPAGQVLIPSNLQSSGPIIPAAVIPTSQARVAVPTQMPAPVTSPDLFEDLTLNNIPENGSLIDGIPNVGEEEIVDFDTGSNSDGRFSMGLALNLNGIGAELADNYGAIGSAFGASVDLGYKISDNFVGRVQFTYDTIDVDAADNEKTNVALKGQLFSGYLLADWHPLGNGFRVTAGPGVSLLKVDGATSYETKPSPYLGIGYDSSLFSPSKFGVWADIGATYLNDDINDVDFFPSANLGVKYRF